RPRKSAPAGHGTHPRPVRPTAPSRAPTRDRGGCANAASAPSATPSATRSHCVGSAPMLCSSLHLPMPCELVPAARISTRARRSASGARAGRARGGGSGRVRVELAPEQAAPRLVVGVHGAHGAAVPHHLAALVGPREDAALE